MHFENLFEPEAIRLIYTTDSSEIPIVCTWYRRVWCIYKLYPSHKLYLVVELYLRFCNYYFDSRVREWTFLIKFCLYAFQTSFVSLTYTHTCNLMFEPWGNIKLLRLASSFNIDNRSACMHDSQYYYIAQ